MTTRRSATSSAALRLGDPFAWESWNRQEPDPRESAAEAPTHIWSTARGLGEGSLLLGLGAYGLGAHFDGNGTRLDAGLSAVALGVGVLVIGDALSLPFGPQLSREHRRIQGAVLSIVSGVAWALLAVTAAENPNPSIVAITGFSGAAVLDVAVGVQELIGPNVRGAQVTPSVNVGPGGNVSAAAVAGGRF